MTGYNLWVYYHTTGDREAILTLEHQTKLDLLPNGEHSGSNGDSEEYPWMDW